MVLPKHSQPYVIPVLRPLLPTSDKVSKYIKKIDQSRTYTNNGPLVQELESRYARILNIGAKNVVAVSNATLGITVSVQNLTPTVWRVPDFTFSATPLAVMYAGREIRLVEVDYRNWVMFNSEDSSETDFGHVVVLPFGNNSEFHRWLHVPNVVFDAAASLGDSNWDLTKLSDTQTAVFSLHATKVFGAGEGGLVVCGSQELADLVRASINFGFMGNRETAIQGTNAKMSEYTAAVALASLDGRFEEIEQWESRQSIAREIAKQIGQSNPNLNGCPVNPYWIMSLRNPKDLSALRDFANKARVETRMWWPKAIHEMDFFVRQNASFIHQDMEYYNNSKRLAETLIGLPMYRTIADIDFERIERMLLEFGTDRFWSEN